MSDFVIETKKLTKIYGEQTAVSSVDIHVKPGRIYGLLGRNGAGTPVQPNVRALKRFAAVIRRRQWGRLRENHARGEIPRGAGELPAV